MTYTGISVPASPVVPELIHRYDLASHAAIGAPITIGTVGTWGGAEGEVFYGGWDVSADGAHIAYQSLASTVTGGGSDMTQSSHWYAANADGSSAVSILPGLTSNDPAYLAISPDGAQVAVTSADPAPNVASGPMSGGATRFYDSPNGFSRPAWRADSQAFYASKLQYIDASDIIAQFPLGAGAHATGSTAITPAICPRAYRNVREDFAIHRLRSRSGIALGGCARIIAKGFNAQSIHACARMIGLTHPVGRITHIRVEQRYSKAEALE